MNKILQNQIFYSTKNVKNLKLKKIRKSKMLLSFTFIFKLIIFVYLGVSFEILLM